MSFLCGRYVGVGYTWCVVLWLLLGGVARAVEVADVMIVADSEIFAATSSSVPVSIRLNSSSAVPARAMIVVRGLPAAVKFSDGRLYGDGVWVMSPAALPRLQIQTASEPVRADLNVALVSLDGTVLTHRSISLRVGSTPAPNGPDNTIPASVASVAPTEAMSQPDRDAAMKLVAMGDTNFKAGDVAAAREYYKRAAKKGLAEAALALGVTYDTDELRRHDNIVGVQPDTALAKEWYGRARDLGSREAVIRLQRLR